MLTADIGPGVLLAGDSLEYRLGGTVAEGGEGVVYRIQGRSDVVAKLYKEWEFGRDEKLRGLIGLSTKRLRRVAAWPLSTLSDSGDRPVGFVMESLESWQPLHAVYQIRSRVQNSPHRSWAFLVRVARNLATCVHHVHEHGLVIGDLNESNVLVGPDAMAKLIDADSFQATLNDRLYPCKVGKPEFLAPELQNRSLEGVERTPNHDRFALAILLFQTLVFGRHPFAGRPTQEAEAPLEEAITQGWYIFAAGRKVPMEPPPGLTLDWLPDSIRRLFDRAFAPGSAERPTAREWYCSLKELEGNLCGCDINGSHVHWNGITRCPWCKLEERWNIILFRPAPLDPLSAADFDVDEVWRRIETLPVPVHPNPPAPIDYETLPLVPLNAWQRAWMGNVGQIALYSGISAAVSIAVGFHGPVAVYVFPAIFASGRCSRGAFYRRRVRRANVRLSALGKLWEERATHGVFQARLEAYDAIRASLLDNGRRYEQLRNERIRELHQPELASYLRKYSILAADAGSTGRGKLNQLHDRGIVSAADIDEEGLKKVRGFDGRFWELVIAWRKALEVQFWGATSFGLPPNEERTILEKVYRQDIAMRRELLAAPEELQKVWEKVVAEQETLIKEAEPYRQTIYRNGPILRAIDQLRNSYASSRRYRR